MQVVRKTAYAHLSIEVAKQIATLRGPCIGCKECRGLCHELIEVLYVPDLILHRP